MKPPKPQILGFLHHLCNISFTSLESRERGRLCIGFLGLLNQVSQMGWFKTRGMYSPVLQASSLTSNVSKADSFGVILCLSPRFWWFTL